MHRSLRSLPFAILIAAVSQSGGCFATPLPDPPSLTTSAMTLLESQPERLTFSGAADAVRLGAIDMRVTSSSGSRVIVATSATGSFRVELGGTLGDTLYLEQVGGGARDVFLGAVRSGGGGTVVPADPGNDRDVDGSPDAVDCDPLSGMFVSRECVTSCATDAECGAMGAAGRCIAGTCRSPACSNDADCILGVETCVLGACTGGCASDRDCAPSQLCIGAVCTGCAPMEVCGNGIDDDCDGIAEDACPP
jgi:hypothetical protein